MLKKQELSAEVSVESIKVKIIHTCQSTKSMYYSATVVHPDQIVLNKLHFNQMLLAANDKLLGSF